MSLGRMLGSRCATILKAEKGGARYDAMTGCWRESEESASTRYPILKAVKDDPASKYRLHVRCRCGGAVFGRPRALGTYFRVSSLSPLFSLPAYASLHAPQPRTSSRRCQEHPAQALREPFTSGPQGLKRAEPYDEKIRIAQPYIGPPHIVRKGQARFRLDPNDTGGKHGGNIRRGKPPRNR